MRDRELMLKILRDAAKDPNGIQAQTDSSDKHFQLQVQYLSDLNYLDVSSVDLNTIYRVTWQGLEFLTQLDGLGSPLDLCLWQDAQRELNRR